MIRTGLIASTKPTHLFVAFAVLTFTIAFLALPVPDTFAQVSGPEKPITGTVPGNTTDSGAADAEIWRQIRQGAQGVVSGQDPKSGLMIQSEGHSWQETRNGPLAMYSAWAIIGVTMLLAMFFALRGRIRIQSPLSGRTIERFTLIERSGHWLLGVSFIVLALTGLNLLFGRTMIMPLIGKEAFSTIASAGKFLHNYVAFAFMASLVMIAILWVWQNMPNRHDVVWLLRGGGFFGGSHPRARKFNAGQKILFWLVILSGISISLSGWALLTPFQTTMFSDTFAVINSWFGTSLPTDLAPVQEQQYQALWHTIVAVFMTCLIIGHIYIATIGMQGALSAMTSGHVDTEWAKEHHAIWYEEMEAQQKDTPLSGEGRLQPAE